MEHKRHPLKTWSCYTLSFLFLLQILGCGGNNNSQQNATSGSDSSQGGVQTAHACDNVTGSQDGVWKFKSMNCGLIPIDLDTTIEANRLDLTLNQNNFSMEIDFKNSCEVTYSSEIIIDQNKATLTDIVKTCSGPCQSSQCDDGYAPLEVSDCSQSGDDLSITLTSDHLCFGIPATLTLTKAP